MRLLIALVLALAVMAGLVVALIAVGGVLGRSVQGGVAAAQAGGPFARDGILAKVAFGILWLLIFGAAFGFIRGV